MQDIYRKDRQCVTDLAFIKLSNPLQIQCFCTLRKYKVQSARSSNQKYFPIIIGLYDDHPRLPGLTIAYWRLKIENSNIYSSCKTCSTKIWKILS